MWKINDDFWKNGALDVFEYKGVPVLVQRTGTYPVAISSDGKTTESGIGYVPHIVISIKGGIAGGAPFYNGVRVFVAGSWVGGSRRDLDVFTTEGDRQTDANNFISLGKQYLDEAIKTLNAIDEKYERAAQITGKAYDYPGPFSRKTYEKACSECGVEALSDKDCQSYGVKYGRFSFPEYAPEHIAKMHLAFRRLLQIEEENKSPAISPEEAQVPSTPCGQLWEPCRNCGEEPVYMPLHLCEKCLPET